MTIPTWLDWPLMISEGLLRCVYWNSPRGVREWVRRRRARRRPADQLADRRELKDYLRSIGLVEGALAMAHTSVSGLQLTEESGAAAPFSPVIQARNLVDDLLELVGESGTLVLPTHARYQSENDYGLGADPDAIQKYDPARTPCGVGLANELFRKRKGVRRSLHPINMLAAHGPMADELLRDNLNHRKPLPHGVDSGYYRFCQHNGLLVGIGIPLGYYMTLIHTAEDVRDADWPVRNFNVEKRFLVCVDGREETYVVRQQRIQYSMYCLCLRKLWRDLVREGILHEGHVGTVRVDWAHSREVYDYLMRRNKNSTYPYYWTWLVRAGK